MFLLSVDTNDQDETGKERGVTVRKILKFKVFIEKLFKGMVLYDFVVKNCMS